MFAGSLKVRDRFDPDAQSYINAVETADGQALEAEVRVAITRFVKGCKSDGIWNAIKASCIMAGARTLAGALVPLVGSSPTNFNFVSEDYNRKTGLKGDGSTKYLSSNRNNNADPQDSKHLATWVAQSSSLPSLYMATGTYNVIGGSYIFVNPVNGVINQRMNQSSDSTVPYSSSPIVHFYGASRSIISSFRVRALGSTISRYEISSAPLNSLINIFSSGTNLFSDSALTFYSIGENIDLTKLDARVTALMNAFNTYIS